MFSHRRSRARAREHTHKRTHTHANVCACMDVQWAPLLYTHCSPLTRTPSFSLLTMWCLLPVVLNSVPIHIQCSNHYLRDEASWLDCKAMTPHPSEAISSNKPHTHTHTHTHTHIQVVVTGPFINFLLHNHSVIYKILIYLTPSPSARTENPHRPRELKP